MQRVLFILVFLLFYSATYADSPPCWCKFEEESANKKYVAIVDRPQKDSLIDPWKSVWTLTVYEKTAIGNRRLWRIKYDYTGYPGGLLSDDGQTFVYVEFWYYASSPLVDIYRQGKKVNTSALKGLNFKVPKDKLVETVSHQLWLWDEGNAYSYTTNNKRLLLEIRTIDGRKHYIDISSGRFASISQRAANTSFVK
ncbi:hypothetical protein [Flavisolibacter nicotianae]|uniref:hypothetical protein n=1 Tax=Flavisolibacter nicotianae TaxID=2364882 RepID=UPI000EB5C231|nr:hypothetical protein [Flavisolibacter nicotianae]